MRRSNLIGVSKVTKYNEHGDRVGKNRLAKSIECRDRFPEGCHAIGKKHFAKVTQRRDRFGKDHLAKGFIYVPQSRR